MWQCLWEGEPPGQSPLGTVMGTNCQSDKKGCLLSPSGRMAECAWLRGRVQAVLHFLVCLWEALQSSVLFPLFSVCVHMSVCPCEGQRSTLDVIPHSTIFLLFFLSLFCSCFPCNVVMTHTFNPSTWEAGTEGSL